MRFADLAPAMWLVPALALVAIMLAVPDPVDRLPRFVHTVTFEVMPPPPPPPVHEPVPVTACP
jgi:hypothetical protein